MFRQLSIFAVCAFFALASGQEKYPDTYDYINAKDILDNDSLRQQYYDCFMDLGPCKTPDAEFFKGYLPEVMATQCKKCTDKQKENVEAIILWYTENRPDEWDGIVDAFAKKAKAMGLMS